MHRGLNHALLRSDGSVDVPDADQHPVDEISRDKCDSDGGHHGGE